MNHDDSDLKFQRYRTLDGSQAKGSSARRNGKTYLSLPPGCAEPASEKENTPLWEQSRLYVNLNPVEGRTWEQILRGSTISQVAREEAVSRQAILARIRGNGKHQGGMIGKNFWVLLWWLAHQRTQATGKGMIP